MPKRSSKNPSPKSREVRFDLFAAEAQKASVAADFNCWDVNDRPMKKESKGNWKVTIDLEPERHECRFWVGGVWQDGPS